MQDEGPADGEELMPEMQMVSRKEISGYKSGVATGAKDEVWTVDARCCVQWCFTCVDSSCVRWSCQCLVEWLSAATPLSMLVGAE